MLIQLRVIETLTSEGHSDVTVDAASVDGAAEIVARAYRQAQAGGSNVVELPNGQSVFIDHGPPRTMLALALLDEDGRELRPVTVPEPPRGRARRA